MDTYNLVVLNLVQSIIENEVQHIIDQHTYCVGCQCKQSSAHATITKEHALATIEKVTQLAHTILSESWRAELEQIVRSHADNEISDDEMKMKGRYLHCLHEILYEGINEIVNEIKNNLRSLSEDRYKEIPETIMRIYENKILTIFSLPHEEIMKSKNNYH